MKREVKIIGVRPYQTNFNGTMYSGTRYYYIFKENGTDGNGCDFFKVPLARSSEFPRISVGDEFIAYIERTQNGARVDDLVPLK